MIGNHGAIDLLLNGKFSDLKKIYNLGNCFYFTGR